MRENQKKWILAIILLLLSVALRLIRLETSFWMDEIITITRFVPEPWLKIISEVPYPNNHILYTLLAKLSILVLGEKEWSARLPALIFGSLTPGLLYLIVRKRFSDLAGFCAGLFLALNYWSVWFSQDARGYSALILFGLLSNWLCLEYLDRGERKLVIAYALVSALCVWFYLYSLFLILGQLLWAITRLRQKEIPGQKLILIFAAALLGISIYLPSLPELFQYALSADKMARLHPVNLLFFKDLLLMLAGSRKIGIAVFFVIISLPGWFYLAEKWRGFVAVNLIAALGIIIVSALFRFFIYPRFLIFLLPVFALGAGLSVKIPSWILYARSNRLGKALSYLLMAVMVLLLIPGLLNYYALGKEGFKDAADYLASHHRGEKIICYGIICPELSYYYSGEFLEASEKGELTKEMIKGKRIISRRVDWNPAHLDLARDFCYTEKVWRSAGYKENILILFNCQ